MSFELSGNWDLDKIADYLDNNEIPLRIACVGADGYPLVCSLWFVYDSGLFWAASHKDAHLIRLLKENPKVGFEVGTNVIPYKGVRGKADVELVQSGAGDVLERLIERYLKEGNKSLADWLLSRKDEEYAIKISPVKMNSWDFSARMNK